MGYGGYLVLWCTYCMCPNIELYLNNYNFSLLVYGGVSSSSSVASPTPSPTISATIDSTGVFTSSVSTIIDSTGVFTSSVSITPTPTSTPGIKVIVYSLLLIFPISSLSLCILYFCTSVSVLVLCILIDLISLSLSLSFSVLPPSYPTSPFSLLDYSLTPLVGSMSDYTSPDATRVVTDLSCPVFSRYDHCNVTITEGNCDDRGGPLLLTCVESKYIAQFVFEI